MCYSSIPRCLFPWVFVFNKSILWIEDDSTQDKLKRYSVHIQRTGMEKNHKTYWNHFDADKHTRVK